VTVWASMGIGMARLGEPGVVADCGTTLNFRWVRRRLLLVRRHLLLVRRRLLLVRRRLLLVRRRLLNTRANTLNANPLDARESSPQEVFLWLTESNAFSLANLTSSLCRAR
jgi:hypothetical protein